MTESYIHWTRSDDGIVTLSFDEPGRRANTMSARYRAAMTVAVDRLVAERESITGVILTSAKDTFFAGADLGEVAQLAPGDVQTFRPVLELVKRDMRRLEMLGRPVVAALNGSALGGGLEIALACHHRIALERPDARFGLPEVTLGLLPGAGGIVRTVRLLGLEAALDQLLLDGRLLDVNGARELGIVDETAETHTQMLHAAQSWIRTNPDAVQPWDRREPTIGTAASRAFAPPPPSVTVARFRRRLKGCLLPAPHNIVCAAVEGDQVDFDTALAIESTYFLDVAKGQIAKNMIQTLWFDLNSIKAGAARPSGYAPTSVKRVAVLGAGMMGAGIAYLAARNGIDAVVKDVSTQAAESATRRAAEIPDGAVRRGSLSADEQEVILRRITATDSYDDLAGCDFVIEAVPEDRPLKLQVLRAVEQVVSSDAVISSNTSSLPITGLASAVTRPADFIGLHFFSPVERMPLVEIVRGGQTSDETVARAVDFTRRIGKVPIVVNDGRGFFTSRVIETYLNEALAMLSEGLAPSTIEQAALQAGYPVGALQLADEVSLTLIARVRDEARELLGAGYRPHPADAVVDAMLATGRAGRLSGGGFYDYDETGRRAGLWPGLRDLFPLSEGATGVSLREVGERMLFIEALEAARCVQEGVVQRPADANVGSVLGIGYPGWTGGALQYVNGYAGGVGGFLARANELGTAYGSRFEPCTWLRQLADAQAR